MTWEDICRKLTSRKFWAAVALFISGLITAFGGSSEKATTISGCIMQGAAVLGYLLAEGLTDAARESTSIVYNGDQYYNWRDEEGYDEYDEEEDDINE